MWFRPSDPRSFALFLLAKVYVVTSCMGAFDAATKKPSRFWSNHSAWMYGLVRSLTDADRERIENSGVKLVKRKRAPCFMRSSCTVPASACVPCVCDFYSIHANRLRMPRMANGRSQETLTRFVTPRNSVAGSALSKSRAACRVGPLCDRIVSCLLSSGRIHQRLQKLCLQLGREAVLLCCTGFGFCKILARKLKRCIWQAEGEGVSCTACRAAAVELFEMPNQHYDEEFGCVLSVVRVSCIVLDFQEANIKALFSQPMDMWESVFWLQCQHARISSCVSVGIV